MSLNVANPGDLRFWLGPWQWADQGDGLGFAYGVPAGAVNVVDLRSLADQATGNREGLSIFATDSVTNLGSDYRALGGGDAAVKPGIWRSAFGASPEKSSLWDNIVSLLLEQSVPGSRNPLTPFGHELKVRIPGGFVWRQQLPRLNRSDPRWAKIAESLKLSVAAVADEEQDDQVTGKRQLASKYLAVRAAQLGLKYADAVELLVPARLRQKISNVKPETSDDDYQNYGGGTPWLQMLANYDYQSGGQTFHYAFGQGTGWGIVGTNSVHIFFRWKATALSSTDQAGRCSWRYKSAGFSRAGVMLRSTAFTNSQTLSLTSYIGYIGTPSNVARPDIAKCVAGTISFVQQGATGESYTATQTRPIEFSAIGSDLELIAATETGGTNQTVSVTDTSITTGFNVGVYGYTGGSTTTPFGHPGAYDYLSSRGFEWEDVIAAVIEAEFDVSGPTLGLSLAAENFTTAEFSPSGPTLGISAAAQNFTTAEFSPSGPVLGIATAAENFTTAEFSPSGPVLGISATAEAFIAAVLSPTGPALGVSARAEVFDIRGNWTIDEAIVRRWESAGLDAAFRAYWVDPTETEYEVLHDQEARPGAPGPYCVYESSEGQVVENHSGNTPFTTHQIQTVPVQFRIHAKTGGGLTGKAKAVALAKLVAAAFDPGTEFLNLAPDTHVTTIREPDFGAREGDEEWVWVLPFSFIIDAVYALRS